MKKHKEHINSANTEKYPLDDNKYVGIELEFNSNRGDTSPRWGENDKMIHALNEAGLGKYCEVGSDHCGFEVRVLLPEFLVYNKLRSIIAVIKKLGYKHTRNCGAHIHLDMRHRPVYQCYNNLVKAQRALGLLIRRGRTQGQWCKYNKHKTLKLHRGYDERDEKYSFVNPNTYDELKTLEVRAHHGTLDALELNEWIRLLIKIVDSPKIGKEAKTLKQLNSTFNFNDKYKERMQKRRTRYYRQRSS